MANQVKDENASTPIAITMEQLQAILGTLAAEMKKPHVDPDVVARNEAARARLRAQRLESEQDLEAIQNSCSHLREDNTARIAWIENFVRAIGLYVREGFCQNCNKHFHPNMKHKEEYIAALKMPTGKAGIIS